jgi:hypothetical protein
VVEDSTREEANLLLCTIEILGGFGSEWTNRLTISNSPGDLDEAF